jgi:hypothetical protein
VVLDAALSGVGGWARRATRRKPRAIAHAEARAAAVQARTQSAQRRTGDDRG